jgi:hypothetical protein
MIRAKQSEPRAHGVAGTVKRSYRTKPGAHHRMREMVTVVPRERVALMVEWETVDSADTDDVSGSAASG